MPIYEYRCEACGHEQEVLQKMSDPPLASCSSCGAPRMKKKVSAAAFRLKGGGWYETDFKSGGKKNLAGDKPANKENSQPDTPAATKTEAKPQAKPEKKATDSSAKSK